MIQVATFEKHQHVSEKEKRSECYPPPPEWRQAEPVSSGAQQGSPRAEPVVKEGSLQADAGTNLVSSRNEPGTTPAASQDQPRSPFSTALPHTALPSENISLCARRKSENARTYVPSFELFWQEYPSHIDKRHAFGCWKARLKEGIAGDLLAACTGHYAAARRGEDERYTMHPSTFLGPGRRWEEFLIHPNESTRGRFIGDPLQPKARGGNSRLVGAGLKPALTWTDEELPAFSPAARAWLDLPTNGERKVADE
ncbi:MAG: hypothetical protein NTV14_07435 [Coprothermobacterota bacterium]|nr:hypothetical protein [Coprothermobacterota bacterium]